MKKYLFLAVALLTSIIAWPAISIKSMFKIELSYSGGVNTDHVQITEVSGMTPAQLSNACSSKNVATGLPQNINIYTISDKTDLGIQGTYGTDSLFGVIPLGIMTNCGAEEPYTYTLTIKDVTINGAHAPMSVVDTYTGAEIQIQENATLNFSANLCDTINDRFVLRIGAFIPGEGELNVCYRYETLSIYNNPSSGNIIIRDADNNIVRSIVPVETPQHVDLSSLEKGKYNVTIGDDILIISVKPEVTPLVP